MSNAAEFKSDKQMRPLNLVTVRLSLTLLYKFQPNGWDRKQGSEDEVAASKLGQ